jgi:hypothetical protein
MPDRILRVIVGDHDPEIRLQRFGLFVLGVRQCEELGCMRQHRSADNGSVAHQGSGRNGNGQVTRRFACVLPDARHGFAARLNTRRACPAAADFPSVRPACRRLRALRLKACLLLHPHQRLLSNYVVDFRVRRCDISVVNQDAGLALRRILMLTLAHGQSIFMGRQEHVSRQVLPLYAVLPRRLQRGRRTEATHRSDAQKTDHGCAPASRSTRAAP